MCTWPHHRKRYRFDSGKSGNHGWLKKKHWLQLEVINYTFTILYMEYKHTTIVCVDHPTRLVPRDPKHQAWAVSACRLPRQGTWLPSVLWWSRERWHSGKKASCSVGWVCLQLGDVTLRKVQRVVFFFPTKKMGYVMSAIITSHLNPYYSFFVSQNGANGRRIQ